MNTIILLHEYNEICENIKKLEIKKNELRDIIKSNTIQENNNVEIGDGDTLWTCKIIKKVNRRADYDILITYPEIYNIVVTQNETEYLDIRKKKIKNDQPLAIPKGIIGN